MRAILIACVALVGCGGAVAPDSEPDAAGDAASITMPAPPFPAAPSVRDAGACGWGCVDAGAYENTCTHEVDPACSLLCGADGASGC